MKVFIQSIVAQITKSLYLLARVSGNSPQKELEDSLYLVFYP